jgi:hypothetical protein
VSPRQGPGVTSAFDRVTFDGCRVRVVMVDERASAWVPQGEYLGESSARVLSLFMSEVCITDRADLPALLADCRVARGDVVRLGELRRNRATRAAARARNAGRPRRWPVEHSPRSLNAPLGCQCRGCIGIESYRL